MTVISSTYSGGNTDVDVDDTVPATIARVDYSILADNSAPRTINGSAVLIEGVYQQLPDLSLTFDKSKPPTYEEYQIGSGPYIPALKFTDGAGQRMHFTFDIPTDWKTDTDIKLQLKGFAAEAEAQNAEFQILYSKLVNGAAVAWSGSTTVSTTLSASSAYYRVGEATLTAASLSGASAIVGTISRTYNDACTKDFYITSVTGYYQKKNN